MDYSTGQQNLLSRDVYIIEDDPLSYWRDSAAHVTYIYLMTLYVYFTLCSMPAVFEVWHEIVSFF